jgi:hypothetical protein
MIKTSFVVFEKNPKQTSKRIVAAKKTQKTVASTQLFMFSVCH